MIKILALDPSLNKTGWVILKFNENGAGREDIQAADYGLIKINARLGLGIRLLENRKELLKICKKHRPSLIVMEDTFSGSNVKTSSRLNNAKGVFVMTAYDYTGQEPILVNANTARACLGFKSGKEDAFEFFSNLLGLPEDFKHGNDITDAYAIGYWYIVDSRDECQNKKRIKNGRRNYKSRQKKNKQRSKEGREAGAAGGNSTSE